jgi:hypothetical protein
LLSDRLLAAGFPVLGPINEKTATLREEERAPPFR